MEKYWCRTFYKKTFKYFLNCTFSMKGNGAPLFSLFTLTKAEAQSGKQYKKTPTIQSNNRHAYVHQSKIENHFKNVNRRSHRRIERQECICKLDSDSNPSRCLRCHLTWGHMRWFSTVPDSLLFGVYVTRCRPPFPFLRFWIRLILNHF